MQRKKIKECEDRPRYRFWLSEEAVKNVFVYITPKVMEIKEESKWNVRNNLFSYGRDRHKSIEPDYNLKALAEEPSSVTVLRLVRRMY